MNTFQRLAILAVGIGLAAGFFAGMNIFGQNPHTTDVLGAANMGTVKSNIVELETPSDRHIYEQAYVACNDKVTSENIEDWEPIPLENTATPADDIWAVDLDSDKKMFQGNAKLDVSQVVDGQFYIFLWGCKTTQRTNGKTAPSDCTWTKPYHIENDQIGRTQSCEP